MSEEENKGGILNAIGLGKKPEEKGEAGSVNTENQPDLNAPEAEQSKGLQAPEEERNNGGGGGGGEAPESEQLHPPLRDGRSADKNAPADPVGDISKRLEGKTDKAEGDGVAKSATPQDIDFSKMSREQIQTLKALFNSTPDAQITKSIKPSTKLRKMNDKIIVEIGKSYNGTVKDLENKRELERPFIPVRYLGEEEFSTVLYSDFINAERVVCPIVGSKENVKNIVEGETYNKEIKGMVEMIRKEAHTLFTVELPDGKEIEIEATVSNA